jgi:hypothetical protein
LRIFHSLLHMDTWTCTYRRWREQPSATNDNAASESTLFHPTLSWLYFSKDSTDQSMSLLDCNKPLVAQLLATLQQIYPQRVAVKQAADADLAQLRCVGYRQ